MEEWLKARAFHSWVNPKDFKKKEDWVWAELNAYHSAEVAKQLLDEINGLIGQAEYLKKKESGEVEVDKFKTFFQGLSESMATKKKE